MNRKINMALLCFICLIMLAGSTFPVQAAMVQAAPPETCTHSAYAEGVASVATGAYDYRDDGHYAQYGVPRDCLKCGFRVYVNISYIFRGTHSWEDSPFEITREDGVPTRKYHCKTSGCPKIQVLRYGIE